MNVLNTLLSKVDSHQGLCELLSCMGYKTKSQLLYVPDLDLPQSARDIIKELFLLSDYNQRFQIYFAKTCSMRRSDFRNILEPFYRRYPQINSLFIFTQDWEEIAFVSPERVAAEPKKVKLLLRILMVDPKNIYHTDIEVLNNLSISEEEQIPEAIWRKHSAAFNVERVTKEFFEAYKSALSYIKEDVLIPQKKATPQEVHSFAQQLLSRIMFLYYLQKKGWLKWKDYVQDKRYIKNLWEKYKQNSTRKDTFYSLWLSSLFFYAFNKKHQYLTLNIPEEIKESFNLMPFLNGGLFTENELDKISFNIPDKVFNLLFDIDPFDRSKGFLERYNFTIREDTPLEVEVAVDPEMLGKVYESLISEEERGKAGIFYTPRIEIDYMCRLSLVEYLAGETGIPKTDLISLVFDPIIILEDPNLSIENLRKIKDAIDRVKIVDPAVGSASFLVGMMNVLVELQRNLSLKIENREENLFALKNKVIAENLYGVDVKDWAVMVGELRLWLSLIIETEEKFMDIYTKPLLPNLTFKIRQGDSLVEEIAGLSIPLRSKLAYIPKNIKDKITMLVDRKIEYFRGGRSSDLKEKDEIERIENEVLREIIGDEIEKLSEEEERLERLAAATEAEQIEMFEIKSKQRSLFDEQIKKLKKKIEEIRVEKARFENLLQEIGKKTKKDYFLWEVDFAEIFAEKGGFDIVIGNPPYVRQEMISFPLERQEDFEDEEEWRKRKRLYKEKLIKSVRLHWGDSIRIDKKSDLYVYFYYHGLALLRPGGVFCFINSNSWLDVGYGAGLQEFILKNMEPLYIIDNLAKRTFAESDVNTVIVLIKRPLKTGASEKKAKDKTLTGEALLKFIAFKKPFEEVIKPDALIKIEETQERFFGEDFRVFPKSRKELLEEGVQMQEEGEGELIKEPMHLPYIGNKWGGKYLRAPEIFFKMLEKGKAKFKKLEDVAVVETYLNTGGADDFFIIKYSEKGNVRFIWGNSKEWRENGNPIFNIEAEYVRPFIKSPEELNSMLVKDEDAVWGLITLPPSLDKDSLAYKYVLWGEKVKFDQRSGCKKRTPWWKLPAQAYNPAKIIWPRLHYDTHKVFYNPNKISYTNFYGIHPKKSQEIPLVMILLSTYASFIKEIFGKTMYGGGALKTDGDDIKRFPIPDPDIFKSLDIIKLFNIFAGRKLFSIFDELGICWSDLQRRDLDLNNFNKIKPDRKQLDKIIFEAIGLTEEEQLEVYRAVVELVKNRLLKARSL